MKKSKKRPRRPGPIKLGFKRVVKPIGYAVNLGDEVTMQSLIVADAKTARRLARWLERWAKWSEVQ